MDEYFKLGNYEYMEVTLIWLVQMSALLADVGLNIREAHVFSTTDGYSLDVFVVDGWHSEVKTGSVVGHSSFVLVGIVVFAVALCAGQTGCKSIISCQMYHRISCEWLKPFKI